MYPHFIKNVDPIWPVTVIRELDANNISGNTPGRLALENGTENHTPQMTDIGVVMLT